MPACSAISRLAEPGTVMLKVAIVGCGKIADAHAQEIGRIEGCRIVAVCDREPLMALQLQQRFPIEASYSDLDELLNESRPDVVHITTPPESHFPVARRCLEMGCHVYIEKPFALTSRDATELIEFACKRGLKVVAGHDDQFTHVARRLRSLVASGFLGDGPAHMESYYGYEVSNTGYAGALLGDRNHWVRRLPGKLLHNVISHGVARIAEHMTSDSPTVIAHGFVSPYLRRLGETEIIDELRVIISEESGATAYFTFSSQMRPSLHEFRIYGSKNGAVLDQDKETLILLRGKRYPSYAEKFIPPITFAGQYLSNLRQNFSRFVKNDFHMKSGMKYLIESFYRSIEAGTKEPIPYREILLTARIMDAIFEQLNATRVQLETVGPLAT
jgi:predicted dehydrogenase